MGEKLTGHAGKALTKTSGALTISEGRYTEANELVGAIWIIQCVTEEEAIAIGAYPPHTDYGVLGLKEVDPTG